MSSPTQRTLKHMRDAGFTAEVVEKWVPVPGYESSYEVSSMGRIRSLPRKDAGGASRAGRQLSTRSSDRDGYTVVGLTANGKTKQHRLHRLVAAAFVANPCGFPEVNHIDCNRANAEAANLEWVTSKGNSEHAKRLGRVAFGGRNGRATISDELVSQVKGKAGQSPTAIAREFGLGVSAVRHILAGRSRGSA